MNRRQWLQISAALGVATALRPSALAAGTRRVEKIGLQLFTLRNAMARDAAATLKVVAAAGYREVETAGTGNLSPAEFKEALEAAGLTSPAAHLPINLVDDGPDAAIEFAQLIGQRYIVVPWLPLPMRNVEGYTQLIDSLNSFGEHCQSEGIQLCYHNHDFEFDRIDGEVVFDRLLRECDASLVQFELDLFWATHAGVDVGAYIAAAPERFPLCHIKDRDAAGNMVDVGAGEIDFEALLGAGTGLRHYFVEHDRPSDPLVTLIASANAVRAMRFLRWALVVLLWAVPASADEWVSLFNGENLDGWIPKVRGSAAGDDPLRTFIVEDGAITVSYAHYDAFDDRFGHLFFETPYAHYRLRMQYRFFGEQARGGQGWAHRNSGVMIHAQAPASMPAGQDFPISLEVQFLGGLSNGQPRPTGNMCSPGTHIVYQGQFTDTHCIAAAAPTIDGDGWVDVEVLVQHDQLVEHYINGELVISYGDLTTGGGVVSGHDPAMKPEGAPLRQGYIALQSESHPVQFRRIEILDLAP